MHSDIGLSNVAHHRHFNKSIIISLVIGLFSLLFGMFLSGLTVNADDSELTSPFTYTTNFKNDATYNSSQAINMQFLLAETAGIKPGDKIQISVGKDSDGVAGFDLSSLQINAVSSGNFFDVSTDGSTNPATITLTAKSGPDYANLAHAGVSIYMKPATSDLNEKSTVSYPIKVNYIRGSQTTVIKDGTLNVNNIPGNSGGGADTLSQEIFGGLGGLTAPSGFIDDGDIYNGNFYAYSPDASSTAYDKNLIYWYDQNATVAWAQVTLPTDVDKVPKSFTWTLSSSNAINLIKDPKALKVYESPDNTHPISNTPTTKWTIDPTSTGERLLLRSTTLVLMMPVVV